eukprot:TRINITY_DN3286_c0_g3_i1.p1 TRINITY_DN3286_c0_g3~~TRINITY_DN3286_c0_g3_i1.p1  ORF type:complete len:658 (+),score=133.61 TRINITY_DN3286_c0_g3_i1:114-2087(+)
MPLPSQHGQQGRAPPAPPQEPVELQMERLPGEDSCGLLLDAGMRALDAAAGSAADRAGAQRVLGMRLERVGGSAVRSPAEVLSAVAAATGPVNFSFAPHTAPGPRLTTPADFLRWRHMLGFGDSPPLATRAPRTPSPTRPLAARSPHSAPGSPAPPTPGPALPAGALLCPPRPAPRRDPATAGLVSELDRSLQQAPSTDEFLTVLTRRIQVAREGAGAAAAAPAAAPDAERGSEGAARAETQEAPRGSPAPPDVPDTPATPPYPDATPLNAALRPSGACQRQPSAAAQGAAASRWGPPSGRLSAAASRRDRPAADPGESSSDTGPAGRQQSALQLHPQRSAESRREWNSSTVVSPPRWQRQQQQRQRSSARSAPPGRRAVTPQSKRLSSRTVGHVPRSRESLSAARKEVSSASSPPRFRLRNSLATGTRSSPSSAARISWSPEKHDAAFFALLEDGIRWGEAAAARPLPHAGHSPQRGRPPAEHSRGAGAASLPDALPFQSTMSLQQSSPPPRGRGPPARQHPRRQPGRPQPRRRGAGAGAGEEHVPPAGDRGPRLSRAEGLDFRLSKPSPYSNISLLRREASPSPPRAGGAPLDTASEQSSTSSLLWGQRFAAPTKTGLWSSLPRSVHDRMEAMAAWRPRGQRGGSGPRLAEAISG